MSETKRIRGFDISITPVKDATPRRAQQFKSKLIGAFAVLDLHKDNIEIPLERLAQKKAPASITWYMEGHRLYYSYDNGRFIDNLHVVLQVIQHELQSLIAAEKSLEEFLRSFSEDDDVLEQRQEARKTLGLDDNEKDMAVIDKRYKDLAKAAHPDMATGSVEEFKRINNAHKILKRELS